jgi:hypothetical protein
MSKMSDKVMPNTNIVQQKMSSNKNVPHFALSSLAQINWGIAELP